MKHIRLKLEATFTVELNESELGALDAIFGYGVEPFLITFKKNLGAAYVEKYEDGVRSLHSRLRAITSPALSEIKETRDKINAALAK